MRVSVVVPSKGCEYLKYLLFSLKEQIVRPCEVILVVKDCEVKAVEKLCNDYSLPCIIVEQRRGFFTTALNIGKRVTSGDIVLFTDDDAIAPRGWIKRYVKAFNTAPRDIGCISSRDIYIQLDRRKIVFAADDFPQTKLYRWFITTWFEPPLEVLKKYRLGVYISKRLIVVHGPYLPDKACLSLPYRGVNMGFRGEVADLIEFPEHPKLRRALGNEQYAGLKLVLSGFKSIYIPNNPILHIYREESLSRTKSCKEELIIEIALMKYLYTKLLARSAQ
ncbi:MAG: glycosyltransferase family A protein [Candidatus Bathyarchaeia archaeon]